MRRRRFGRLRRQPGYPRFFAGATLARLSNEMFAVAVVLYILDRTGSAALAGATIACGTFPSLVTGPFLGAWFDRVRRRPALLALDQVVAAVTLVAILAAAGSAPAWVLLAIAVVSGTTLPLSGGGFTSLIPGLVPEELWPEANALEAASFNLATIAGPALAGVIVALADPAAAVLVEIGLYVVALVAVLGIRDPGGERGAQGPLKAAVVAGLRHVVRTPALAAVTAAGSLALLGRGLLVIAFPFFAVSSLGSGQSAAGYLWAAFALGSMSGALGLIRFGSGPSPERVVLAATGFAGIAMLAWPLAASLPPALALIALAGFVYGPGLGATFTVRQRHTPPALRGQVFMTAASLKPALFSIGAALAGPATVGLGAEGTLLLAASIQLIAAAAGWAILRLAGGSAAPS